MTKKAIKMYAVQAIYIKQDVQITHKDTGEKDFMPISLTWADGMIGVMPVFKTKKQAMSFYKGEPLTLMMEEIGK
jgi:hypothetical protein